MGLKLQIDDHAAVYDRTDSVAHKLVYLYIYASAIYTEKFAYYLMILDISPNFSNDS